MKSGVYLITIDEYFYVGSSIDIKQRWRKHLEHLSKNKHASSFLQNVYNKRGTDNITFEVLEYCVKELLIEREQFHLDYYFATYKDRMTNIRRIADSNVGVKRPPASAETRKKVSEARKGKARKPFTEEHRKKIGDAARSRVFSEETRKKLSEANKGKLKSEEHRKKLSEANKGKTHSEETRRKISEAKRKRDRQKQEDDLLD